MRNVEYAGSAVLTHSTFLIRHSTFCFSADTGTRQTQPVRSLRFGMRLPVHLDELPVVQMRVLLRRRERGVAEELLDAAQVRAGVEEMRGERVAHGVRGDPG